jgi:hypothetical protein
MYRRAAQLIIVALLLSLVVPVTAFGLTRYKVVNMNGTKVGFVEGKSVFNRLAVKKGYLVDQGGLLSGVYTASNHRVAFVDTDTYPLEMYRCTDTSLVKAPKYRVGTIIASGPNWLLYKKVNGMWFQRGIMFGGRSTRAAAALRLLLWAN